MSKFKLFQYLVTHIFLPNKLPKNNDGTETFEIKFLNIINKVINQYSDLTLLSRFEYIKILFSNWELFQVDLDTETINSEIDRLNEGNSLAFYLKEQNATILISRLSQHQKYRAVISCFGVNAKNFEVMSTKDSLTSWYPWYSFYIDNQDDGPKIKSKTFSNLLAKLGSESMETNLRTTRKGGINMPEQRDVYDPKYVNFKKEVVLLIKKSLLILDALELVEIYSLKIY